MKIHLFVFVVQLCFGSILKDNETLRVTNLALTKALETLQQEESVGTHEVAVGGQEFITIGTAGVTGVYYPEGGAMCMLVNRGRNEHKIRCSVESTPGSVYNINTIRNGELDFGLAQESSVYQAYNGVGEFAEQGNYKELRAMFSLHTDMFMVVARADSRIESIEDLKGKRVNVGNPGSGDRLTMSAIMDMMGWTLDSFKLASELKGSQRSQALCDNKIDAFVYMIGNPNGSIKEAIRSCGAKLIPVQGSEINKFVATNSLVELATLTRGMYTDKDIKTFGERVILVTTSDVSDDVAYNVAKSVFKNFTTFRRLHPAFKSLNMESMAQVGIIPLHPGAAKYFKEADLLK